MTAGSYETWKNGYDEGRRHGHKEAAGQKPGAAPPNSWKISQAMSVWQSTRARLLHDDAELAQDEAALSALLGSEAGDVRDVLARVLRAARHAEAMADAAKEQMTALKGRQDRYKRRGEQLRATGFAILDALGESRFETADFTASIRAGVPSLTILDQEAIPSEFIRISEVPEKPAIIAALKAGREVGGCVLAAGLPSLTIRSV